MSRIIKFRRAHFDREGKFIQFTFWGFIDGGFASPNSLSQEDKKLCVDSQYIEVEDKNQVEIFEGDILRFREPYRTTQSHYGDNIPNCKYTEPMEAAIRTIESEVKYNAGMFYLDFERIHADIEHEVSMPLMWMIQTWDIDSIKEAIRVRSDDFWDWFNDPDEGDAKWLMDEYKLSSLEELCDYCSGIEVIGNVFENPHE